MTEAQSELLKGTFLEEDCYDLLIEEDTDAYDTYGNLLFKFRKNVMPIETLKIGYEAFKEAITLTRMRGVASGKSYKPVRKNGKVSKTNEGAPVFSSTVGYMDSSTMNRFCRKTAFTKNYFDKFQAGVPFVKKVDSLYEQLCPGNYSKQIAIANGTNRNYVIADTSFTTVTVNKNFQTAVHKDSGDFPEGFGNLCVYREGSYEGSYFCLPEFRVAIDMQNTDMLFVDVHKWHGNTPFKNQSEDYLRVSFVMYYREQMKNCSQPSEELRKTKMAQGGFLKL